MKVLIIEDNLEFAEMLGYFLQDQGIEFVVAKSFDDIKENISSCDAVISDYHTKPICDFSEVLKICDVLNKKIMVLTGEVDRVTNNQYFKMDVASLDYKAILGQNN
jgi:DNA-binding response OmpR family regulator